MREYENKILLLHLFSSQLRMSPWRGYLDAGAITVGPAWWAIRFKL
jgi:hypothetical protein